jgi:hypothetical protein
MPMPPSAADWTRFKRLTGTLRNPTYPGTAIVNRVTPPTCATAGGCSVRAGVRRDQDQVVGSSKIRNQASNWTDVIAAANTDIVTVSSHPGSPFGSFGRVLRRTQLCSGAGICTVSTLPTKVGPLRSTIYQHSRIV